MSAADDAARNRVPTTRARAFWPFLALVSVAGGVLLVVELLSLHGGNWTDLGTDPAFLILLALVLLAELRPLVTVGRHDADGVITSAALSFAMLLYAGLPAAVLLQAIAAAGTGLIERKAWFRTTFNVGQYTLSLTAAALILRAFGFIPVAGHPSGLPPHDLPGMVLAGVAYFVVNYALVTGVLALRAGASFLEYVHADLAYEALTTAALLAMSPLISVVMMTHAWLLPLFIVPLLALYQNASVSRESERQAVHDPLTGLPNRTLLVTRTRQALADARESGAMVGLFLLDLDRFKEVNDTLGHHTGDRLLEFVAARLRDGLRPNDTVARLGGDEFAILLPEVADAESAADVARRTVAVLDEPFTLNGMALTLEASLGIALSPQHGDDVEVLLQRADVAMYFAKSSRSGVEAYSPDRDRNSLDRLALMSDLRRGLEDGEVGLHYQPKVAIADGAVTGLEALVRWQHAERGALAPDEFIPVAEQTGLMPRLTAHIVDLALAQAAGWWRQGLRVPVAVNVSMRDVHDVGLVRTIAEGLRRHGVPGAVLQLEITERVLVDEPLRAAGTLAALDRLGVRLSLDDFGTGYSSLATLRRLPVHEIKIDHSFVGGLVTDDDDAAIVRSTIELAHSLGVDAVAEGVESAETWAQLSRLGCDGAQGHFVAHPMPVTQATEWLMRNTRTRAAWRLTAVDGSGGSGVGRTA